MKRTGTRYRANRIDTDYDVIVIGSGVGGLCNAALLSKLGKKVCVLEQHYTAGGYTHTYEREGFEWDVGVHYVGEVHKPWSLIRKVFDYITDGKLDWAYMDKIYDRCFLGENEYEFPAGRAEFIEKMTSYFPEEHEAIKRYVSILSAVNSKVPTFFAGQAMPRGLAAVYNRIRDFFLPNYFYKTTREVLETLTKNEELIGVLTTQWGDYALSPKESSFFMHAMVAKHYITGGNFPVGGSSKISETIIPIIQQSGGNVFTYAPVEEVLIRNNTAYGVRLKNGDEIKAKQVVSCAGLLPTIRKLLPKAAVKAHKLDVLSESMTPSMPHLCIYAGFNGTAEELGLPKTNFWIYPGCDHDANVEAFRNNPDADMPLIYISYPSAKDPTWNARYSGKATVEIVAPTHYKWFKKWENTQWNKRGEDYEAMKEQLTQSLMEVLYQHHPQLREALAYVELSTPLSTKWFQWNEEGEIYGVDHTVHRFKQKWLHPITPIKNFYLTGSDILTAGVGGALMGGLMTFIAMEGLKSFKVLREFNDQLMPWLFGKSKSKRKPVYSEAN